MKATLKQRKQAKASHRALLQTEASTLRAMRKAVKDAADRASIVHGSHSALVSGITQIADRLRGELESILLRGKMSARDEAHAILAKSIPHSPRSQSLHEDHALSVAAAESVANKFRQAMLFTALKHAKSTASA